MWFDVLKWLSEQDDATTVAELQAQLDLIIKSVNGLWSTVMTVQIVYGILVAALFVYILLVDRRLKKIEEALLK